MAALLGDYTHIQLKACLLAAPATPRLLHGSIIWVANHRFTAHIRAWSGHIMPDMGGDSSRRIYMESGEAQHESPRLLRRPGGVSRLLGV
jgi:hypothetical protein